MQGACSRIVGEHRLGPRWFAAKMVSGVPGAAGWHRVGQLERLATGQADLFGRQQGGRIHQRWPAGQAGRVTGGRTADRGGSVLLAQLDQVRRRWLVSAVSCWAYIGRGIVSIVRGEIYMAM